MEHRTALILLSYAPGIGPKTLLKLMRYWPNLAELFAEFEQSALRHAIPERLAFILKNPNWQQFEADMRWQEGDRCALLSYADSCYPKLLREIPQPPMRLYLKGQKQVLQQASLSIVGTRHPSDYGGAIASDWSWRLSRRGLCLVSGLAIGIDGLVHQAALAAKGSTIAVLASGLEHIYPHRHRDMALKIIENGALLSEFSPKISPKTGQFPQRNRIICGLSLITLILRLQ